MEFTGKVAGLVKDWNTGKFEITFSVNEESVVKENFDRIKNVDKLSVKAVKYREKRSLDANAYFHVLVGKIADALTISKTRCKNILICRYGQPERLEDDSEVVYKTNAPVTYMLEQEYLHCQPVGCKEEGNGKTTFFYKIYRGSHAYNTKEMSCLIDGTVAEAKELGIETMTPDELREMKERWNV